MESTAPLRRVLEEVTTGRPYWLFLDYDGTLKEFELSPEELHPDLDLIRLLAGLSAHPRHLRLVILSGRRLSHLRQLIPLEGIVLAGNYGIESRDASGEDTHLPGLDTIRAVFDRIKPHWEALIHGRAGFFLEDKGYAMAIHASRADPTEAQAVLAQALATARLHAENSPFRILAVPGFLEIAPDAARKSFTVDSLLQADPWPGAGLVYFGDDDRDEEAFVVVQRRGGLAVLVSRHERPTAARVRLESPAAARRWLADLLAALENTPG